jgi:Ca2+/Na+ antiporter
MSLMEEAVMSETTDILINAADREFAQAKQSEDQRANITGLIVVVASAIQGGLTQTGLNKNALPLTIMLIVLGLFGMLASMKLYERARRHTRLGFLIRNKLEELHPDIQLSALLEITRKEQQEEFPVLRSVRLYIIWMAFHCLITILGVIYTVIAILH